MSWLQLRYHMNQQSLEHLKCKQIQHATWAGFNWDITWINSLWNIWNVNRYNSTWAGFNWDITWINSLRNIWNVNRYNSTWAGFNWDITWINSLWNIWNVNRNKNCFKIKSPTIQILKYWAKVTETQSTLHHGQMLYPCECWYNPSSSTENSSYKQVLYKNIQIDKNYPSGSILDVETCTFPLYNFICSITPTPVFTP